MLGGGTTTTTHPLALHGLRVGFELALEGLRVVGHGRHVEACVVELLGPLGERGLGDDVDLRAVGHALGEELVDGRRVAAEPADQVPEREGVSELLVGSTGVVE